MNSLFTKENLERILTSALESNPYFLEVCELVRANAVGNVWLIGGAVSRTLASELYGVANASSKFDFDFVTDGELVGEEIVPDGWNISYSTFGSPIFTRGTVSVDLWQISSYEYVEREKLEPTIENLLKGMPYTIQMMAYNIKTKKLIGDVGISALASKVFEVNDIQSATSEAERKGVTVSARMELKAKSMGFTVKEPSLGTK